MNLKIENIKRQLVDVINQSGLPIGVIHYLFKDLQSEISKEYSNAVMNELKLAELEKQDNIQENSENSTIEQ